MSPTTTPATRISQPACQAFQFYTQAQILNGAVTFNPTAVLSYQNLDILGDANAVPEVILNLGTPGWNENLSGAAQLATVFGEEVTRADGTKLTTGDLIQSILQARAVTLSAALVAEAAAKAAAAASTAATTPAAPTE